MQKRKPKPTRVAVMPPELGLALIGSCTRDIAEHVNRGAFESNHVFELVQRALSLSVLAHVMMKAASRGARASRVARAARRVRKTRRTRKARK